MSDVYLFLRAPGAAEGNAQWPALVRTAPGQVSPAQLDDLPPELAVAAVVVVLPMEMAGYCMIGPVPGRHPGRDALAYAVEEQLATPLEAVHLAFGPVDEKGRRKVMAIESERLRQVLSRLQAQGIDPVAVYVDADLLGVDRACALWFEGRWLLGGTEGARLAISHQAAQALRPHHPSIRWWAETGSQAADDSDQRVVSAVETLVQGNASAVDLRQGLLRRRRKGPVWHGVAGGALLALLMVCLADYLRVQWVLQQASQQHAENVQVLQRWAPEQPAGMDLATRVRLLEHIPNSSTAVEQLASFAEQLVGAGNVTIERAETGPAQGWRVEVVAQGFDDLERLGTRVPGMRMEHGRQADQGVRASLSWQEVE